MWLLRAIRSSGSPCPCIICLTRFQWPARLSSVRFRPHTGGGTRDCAGGRWPLPDPDRHLALGVCGLEGLKRLGRAVELVSVLDGRLQFAGGEQFRDALEALSRRLGHDVGASGALAGGARR